jgi:hypothetical protein
MPRQYGSDSSIFQTLTTQITDASGVTVVDTGNGFGSSPMGVSLREQVLFGLPNASFNLLPPDPSAAIEEYNNPLPFWQVQTTSNITATSIYDSTTQTWGIKVDPGTAPSGDYITLKTRSWVSTDDNLALRQKASLTMVKNGSYAGATQWNLTLSAVYYDYTNTALGTTVIGTVYDNTTWTSISGTTTTGGSAIPASASWAEFTITLTTTATVSSSTSVTLQSLLLATSNPMTGSFLIADSFTASGTWTRPTGVNFVTVVAVGGGGGGAGGGLRSDGIGASNSWGGPSGGSSSWAIIRDLYVGGDTTVSVGIGTAGVGGTAKTFSKAAGATTVNTGANENAGSGGAGGATTFGTYLTIPGGGGATSQSTAGGRGAAGAAPTSGIFGLTFLGAVLGRDSTGGSAGNAGSASTYTQLPGWSAAFSAGAAGTDGVATGGNTNYSGTAGLAGSAGIIGGGGAGGRPEWNATNFTTASISGGAGGYGAGSGGGPAGAYASATRTMVVTAGAGGSGAANAGGGGGGGGGALVAAATSTPYNASTITATSGAGGNGSLGRLYVIYTA